MSTGAFTLADVDRPKGQFTNADLQANTETLNQLSGQESAQSKQARLSDPGGLNYQIQKNPFRALQIPFEGLGEMATAEHDRLADRMLTDAADGKGVSKLDYVKSFMLDSAATASKITAGALSPEGIGVGVATALAPEVMGPVLVAHGTVKTAQALPKALEGDPQAVQDLFSSAAEAVGGAAAAGSSLKTDWLASRAKVRRLSGAMMTPAEAAEIPAGAPPPRAISHQMVADEATREGIDLTAAQATRERSAQMIQGIGETTLTPGGPQLQDALEMNRGRFAAAMENFVRAHDPYAQGLTTESAGQALQTSAKMALEIAKDNANIAYKQAGIDQANIAVKDLQPRLQKFVDNLRNVKQPGAAVTQPQYQGPEVEAALKDIEKKIADERLGPNASVQSARNLRTEFWEKANDYSGTIPNAAKAIYKQAAEIPDDAMMNAANGTPFEQSFRDASAQWKALKSKFDEPGQPLHNLLQAGDAKQAYNSMVGSKSADVIAKLKAENIDLGPIQSQVVQDIVGKNFRVTGNTLAGYPDSFLKQLFGPDAAQELYTKGEIARRMNFEANPSGSGRIRIAWDQLGWNPASWVRGETAARASMPRSPGSFISPNVPAQPSAMIRFNPATMGARMAAGSQGADLLSPITGAPIATPAQLFKRNENPQ